MLKLISAALALALAGSAFAADEVKMYDPKSEKNHIVVPMATANGSVGEVVIVETKYGLAFYPDLKGIEPGVHGFHVHANADCGADEKGAYAMKAGGHYDPKKAKDGHSFPWNDNGHLGDLPAVYATADGVVNTPVLAPKLKKLKDVKNHALMVHVGGDNHHDHPKPLGGGGARLVCGVIK